VKNHKESIWKKVESTQLYFSLVLADSVDVTTLFSRRLCKLAQYVFVTLYNKALVSLIVCVHNMFRPQRTSSGVLNT
jgi:hypothetical protein